MIVLYNLLRFLTNKAKYNYCVFFFDKFYKFCVDFLGIKNVEIPLF
jgi:hypothetical protein